MDVEASRQLYAEALLVARTYEELVRQDSPR